MGLLPMPARFWSKPKNTLDLLSNDPLQEAGWDDVTNDAFDQDLATAEFRRAHQIRQKARVSRFSLGVDESEIVEVIGMQG